MSFLAPLFLFGALAVALPVVFHLIRRTAKEKLPFSSLMFLQPTPPRLTRRSRLENIFLLLLRCLVLCLLALGFARPFFRKPIALVTPPASGKKIVLLMDDSASMRRQGLWADALSKAGEVLNKTLPADQVAVFTFDLQAHPFVSFEEWASMNAGERAALTARRLTDLKPGWLGTHLGNALITAVDAFAGLEKQGAYAGQRHIVLITDLQEGAQLDGLQGYDWPRGIDVEVDNITARRPTNAGLQWVMDADDSTKPDGDTSPRVRVSNVAISKREQFQIRWDGVPGAAPLDVYVPPGQSRIVPAPKLPVNTTGERLVLRGDDDDFDNTIFRLQPKPEQVSVLFLGDDAEKDPSQLLYYLSRAFQQTRRQTVRVIARSRNALLSPAEAATARLLIVGGVLPEAQLKLVQKHVMAGGTALFILRDAASVSELGVLAGTNNLSAVEAETNTYAMFGQIDFENPLLAPFADPRFSDFTKIHFWRHRRLDTENLPGVRALARFDNGDAALLEVLRGRGRLFVLTAGWQPSESQLALSSKFVPLLYSLLEQAGGETTQISQYRIGDEVNLGGVMTTNTAEAVTIRKPDGSEVRLSPGENRFSQTDQPGIYTLGSLPQPLRFAVNLDAAESRTAPMPVEELMRFGVPVGRREVELAKQVERQRQLHDAELEEQQKLWRWLIVAALVVLLMETWLAGWLTRRATTQAVA